MRSRLPLLGLLASTMFLGSASCGGEGSSSSNSGPGSTSTSASGTGGSGAGGMASSSSTTGTGGAATGTGGGGASSVSSSGTGGASPSAHLLISEVGVQPAAGEFIEIYNPGPIAVDLSQYYLSDNSTYHRIAAGLAWMPITNNPGTDFLAQFPAGTTIAPGAALVIAVDPAFEMQFMKCPDLILSANPLTCANGTAKAMIAPTNGDLGMGTGMLSNDREMLILFRWDGAAQTVEDVDYITWGTTFDDGTRVDKTGIVGYQPDTARASQKPAPAPNTNFHSVERCSLEQGETLSGGNGADGHDETSESLDVTFKATATPTPGAKNPCLP